MTVRPVEIIGMIGPYLLWEVYNGWKLGSLRPRDIAAASALCFLALASMAILMASSTGAPSGIYVLIPMIAAVLALILSVKPAALNEAFAHMIALLVAIGFGWWLPFSGQLLNWFTKAQANHAFHMFSPWESAQIAFGVLSLPAAAVAVTGFLSLLSGKGPHKGGHLIPETRTFELGILLFSSIVPIAVAAFLRINNASYFVPPLFILALWIARFGLSSSLDRGLLRHGVVSFVCAIQILHLVYSSLGGPSGGSWVGLLGPRFTPPAPRDAESELIDSLARSPALGHGDVTFGMLGNADLFYLTRLARLHGMRWSFNSLCGSFHAPISVEHAWSLIESTNDYILAEMRDRGGPRGCFIGLEGVSTPAEQAKLPAGLELEATIPAVTRGNVPISVALIRVKR
jgi:hypothetical protein